MRALITGSSGFIGKYLVEQLKRGGFEILNIPHEDLHNGNLDSYLKFNPRFIFHLASYGNLFTQNNEDEIIKGNITATYNLLKATRKTGYKAFVYVSSSSVDLPHQTLYSASKLACEALCKAFVDEYDKPIIIGRLSTVISKGEQKQHLIPKLIESCKTDTQIPFIPYPRHDFIDVRDCVNALILLAEKATEKRGQAFNISSGKSFTNEHIKNIVEALTGKKVNLEQAGQLRNYDTFNWTVDNSRLRMLGWEPKFSLEDTIKSML